MTLKIAVQKSGRLYDESIKLLKDCGLKVDNGRGQLKAKVRNFDAEILYLRNSDIPEYLEDGVADLAIIGENVIEEKNADVQVLTKLGFSKCRLSIATPRGVSYTGTDYLNGKRIATSYPHTLSKFLKKHNLESDIHQISGSVEIAPNIGLADAICDLVSTGSTLFTNGLEEQEVILQSQAVLAANKNALKLNREIVDDLVFRVESVLRANQNRYILFNIPNEQIEEASRILPVLKSPTILPLLEEGWSSLHSVISEDDFWTVIGKLKKFGAQGILVIPIEKMVI